MQQNYTNIFTSLPARHMSRTKDAAFFFPSSDPKGFASLLFASLCLWLWEVGNLQMPRIVLDHAALEDLRSCPCIKSKWAWTCDPHILPRAGNSALKKDGAESSTCAHVRCCAASCLWSWDVVQENEKIAKHDNQEFGIFWNWIVLHFKTARPRASVPNSTYLGPIMSKQIYVQIWANKYMSKYVKILRNISKYYLNNLGRFV